jgi:transcriptional regulator
VYIPDHFAQPRLEVVHELIRQHPLAALVVAVDGELHVAHLPMVFQQRGEHGTLLGHVARANPIWQQLGELNAVAIFNGPQAYISPNWYASKHAHGKVVPTWNYAVVHAHGRPRAVQDRDWLLAQVSQMTAQQEAGQPAPWQVSDAPAEFTERLLANIVGIELPIEILRGSWKLSQNRSMADQLGVVAGLRSGEDAQAGAVAELMKQRAGSDSLE